MEYLHWDDFLTRLDKNQVLAQELARDFLESVDQRWLSYEKALETEEPSARRLEHAAHALRGLLVPYGAPEATLILKSVEEEARKGRLSGLDQKEELEQILVRLKIEIRAVLDSLMV